MKKPKPEVIRLKDALSDGETDALLGKFVDDSHYDVLIQGRDVDVFEPDGTPLIVFRSRILPEDLCKVAYPALRTAARTSNNRGYAAGDVPEKVEDRKGERVRRAAVMTGTRARPKKNDGTVSNTNYAQEVESGIIGYYDRNVRFPYCRLTAFTEKEVSKWAAAVPYFKVIDGVFARELPDRHAAQMEMISKTPPEFVIQGTSFTTVTVNRNWRCVDEETECLSKKLGWTTHHNLNVGDEILAYDPETHTTRWEKVEDLYTSDYDGELVRLSARGFDSLTTRNHKWPLYNHKNGTREIRYSQDIYEFGGGGKSNNGRPLTGLYLMRAAPYQMEGAESLDDDLVRLVAWYMTEGHYAKTSMSIAQSKKTNPDKVNQIRELLLRLGARSEAEWPLDCSADGCRQKAESRSMCAHHRGRQKHLEMKAGVYCTLPGGGKGKRRREGLWLREQHRKDEVVCFVLKGTGIDSFLSHIPGKEKIPTADFISSLSPRQARIFVETCIAGDGYEQQGKFRQNKGGRMEVFVAACVLAGICPSVCGDEKQSCSTKRTTIAIALKSLRRTLVPYKGKIWCPSLPSGFWVAKRAGGVFITGNTSCHRDKGDLKAGFGVMSAFRAGKYTGGYLCFPKFRVAVDMGSQDLLLANVHHVHGNTPLLGIEGAYERISIVCYFRENMVNCGTLEEEVAQAKKRSIKRLEGKSGGDLFPKK